MKSEFLERNRNINRGFRKLEIWKKAVEIYGYHTTKAMADHDE